MPACLSNWEAQSITMGNSYTLWLERIESATNGFIIVADNIYGLGWENQQLLFYIILYSICLINNNYFMPYGVT